VEKKKAPTDQGHQAGGGECYMYPPTGAHGRWELGARSGAGYPIGGATPLGDHFTTSQVVFDKHGLNTKGQAACNLFVTISRVLEKLLQLVPVRFSPTNHHRLKNILHFCQKDCPSHAKPNV